MTSPKGNIASRLRNDLRPEAGLPLFDWAMATELKTEALSLYDVACSCVVPGMICVRCQMLYLLERKDVFRE